MFAENCPCGESDCDRAIDICRDEKGARISIFNGRVRYPMLTGGGPDMSQTLVSFEGLKELRDKIDAYLKESGHEQADTRESGNSE